MTLTKKKIRTAVAGAAVATALAVAGAQPASAGTEMNGYFPWVKGCDADQAPGRLAAGLGQVRPLRR
ncbi:hypothetical protein [Terrabacter sp. MAHUQ-38]|uniref:hypothetical protein n=1 Tax=unclassified Terrabacter TaxID=2630222 RepID=UPI00165E767D|nr:hypothetical protein [Terrabacter sp. MAHUQ-38]MBC9820334.1 hypothetical protein [Terrabacter sp. MAHUQ-38]